MTDNTILARFCKSGDLHHLSRRLHAMPRTGIRHALDMIAAGIEPEKALRRARSRMYAERRKADRIELPV